MAKFTRLRKPRLHVIGIVRSLEIFQMARNAGRAAQVVVVVHVAVGTLPRRHSMRSSQREVHQRVIETRRLPGYRGVALLAGLGEVGRYVIGVGRSLKILQVTGDAGGAGQIVVVIDVTIRALPWRNGVRSRQREPDRGMVELRIEPVVETMALFTRKGKLAGGVIGIAGLLVVLRMTRVALGRQSLELTGGSTGMTRIAVKRSVGAQ